LHTLSDEESVGTNSSHRGINDGDILFPKMVNEAIKDSSSELGNYNRTNFIPKRAKKGFN
jgi:hypothetical protein